MSIEAEVKTLQKIIKLAQKCPKLINCPYDEYRIGIDKNYITNRALQNIVLTASKELKRLQPNYPINIQNANNDDVTCDFKIINKYFNNNDYYALYYNNKVLINCSVPTANNLIYHWTFFINPIQNKYIYLASYYIYDDNNDTIIEYFCRKDNPSRSSFDAVVCEKTKILSKKQAIKLIPECVQNTIIEVYYHGLDLAPSSCLEKII